MFFTAKLWQICSTWLAWIIFKDFLPTIHYIDLFEQRVKNYDNQSKNNENMNRFIRLNIQPKQEKWGIFLKVSRDLKHKIWHRPRRMMGLGLKCSLRKVKIGMYHFQRCETHSLVPQGHFCQNLFRALDSNYTLDLKSKIWHRPPRMLGLGLKCSLEKFKLEM